MAMQLPRTKITQTRWILVSILVILFCGVGLSVWRFSAGQQPKSIQTNTKQIPKDKTCAPSDCASTSSSLPTPKYIAMGKIPKSGLEVGATFYGALDSPENGHYIPSNLIQGGIKNGGVYNGYDDNGEGACDGKYTNLSDQATWAEDDNGTILGNLPCGTKLEISYHNHTIIAEKGDTSDGGCTAPATRCSDGGHEREIDLWWQSAKALCFSDQPDVMTIHAVPASTPTTTILAYNRNNPRSTATCK